MFDWKIELAIAARIEVDDLERAFGLELGAVNSAWVRMGVSPAVRHEIWHTGHRPMYPDFPSFTQDRFYDAFCCHARRLLDEAFDAQFA